MGHDGVTTPKHRLGVASRMHFGSVVQSAAIVMGVSVATVAPVALAPLASAQEAESVESIIASIEQFSKDTEKISEDVNKLDEDVARKEDELKKVQGKIDSARGDEVEAQAALDRLSGGISEMARQRMRGESVDPLTAVIGATDAQDAIDRSSYLKQIFRREEQVVADTAKARDNATAAKKQQEGAKSDLERQLEDLTKRRADLDRRKAELDTRADDIRAKVDAMDPATRAAWLAKDNPLTEGLGDFLGMSGAVDAAMTKLGAPYSWGAVGPDAFDCSGLMYWAYQQMGVTIPRTSQAQLAGGTPVSREELRPGDIIGFYPGITHVGMYIGNGQIVHASDYGIPVQVVSIDQGGPYQGAVRY